MNFERLRELVLERAIRGELVPQNCDEDCVKEGTSEDHLMFLHHGGGCN